MSPIKKNINTAKLLKGVQVAAQSSTYSGASNISSYTSGAVLTGGTSNTGRKPDADELARAVVRLKLLRILDDGKQTLGVIQVYNTDGVKEMFEIKSVELPYLGNKNSISAVPPGKYLVRSRYNEHYGNHFHLISNNLSSPPFSKLWGNGYTRTGVLIHRAANSAWLAGCIGPGTVFNSSISAHTTRDGAGWAKKPKDIAAAQGGIAGNAEGNPYGFKNKAESLKGMGRLVDTLWKPGDPKLSSFYLIIENDTPLRTKGTPDHTELRNLGVNPTIGT